MRIYFHLQTSLYYWIYPACILYCNLLHQTTDTVVKLLECRDPMRKVGSAYPHQVKPVIYDIDTFH